MSSETSARPQFMTGRGDNRGIAVVAIVTAAVLLALSTRYGYSRDELYFLACGRHLAWGYPDQPPLAPLLARLMSGLAPGSLLALRLPSDLAAAATVVGTGLIARELGATRRAQVLAAAVIAVSNLLLATGHLLSTTTFLLTGTTALLLLALRLLRTRDTRWWLAIGAVTGIGLLDSDLVAFVVGAIVAGILLVGPRRLLWSQYAAVAAAVAGVMWLPYLLWQGRHGWPQLAVAHAIAHGGSGTSSPRWQIVVMQLVLCSPPLVPIWVAGLVRLSRRPELAWCRALAIAYAVLLAAFLVTGGKPYYLAVMFPLLVAAGAGPAVAWVRSGRVRARRVALAFALVAAAVPDAFITLPLTPVTALHATPVVALDYDVGETVGWPAFTQEVAAAWNAMPAAERARGAVVTANYGEAGAIDRFGAAHGLPHAYSGHNAYWLWGPPPASTATVLAVGIDPHVLDRMFRSVTPAGTIDNRLHVGNDEQGTRLWTCRGLRHSWRETWQALKRLG